MSVLTSMLVPVVVDGATKEWSLLEFQGDVIAGDGVSEADMRGLDIGTLRFGIGGGEITLRIGNHLLTGKVAKLAKPFAILQKNKQHDGDSDVEMKDTAEDEGDKQVQYEVVGVVKTRVVFASRPKPMLD
ncbi:hypothetical protein BBJ29_004088 [Phytophthora kernoviae]|uniref:Chromosome transmission fidelity protein 8 n=1 Tax=Phytophthora kernoviae TaxID=325452 RepID=A0A3F2RJF9_9STRA|nr:hypothetical protein BBJ29_004088 [Phytophthora kernoviae]RLN58390.1 hypothetical protein BBP00_00007024 [Phytophthora kernoviae]